MRKKTLYIIAFLTVVFFAFKLIAGFRVINNAATDAYPKIEIQKPMLLNESALGDAWKLVDEQQLIGDPAKGTGKKPITNWQIDWNKKDYYPISAVIDLGGLYELSHIYLYDGSGVGSLVISGGEPFKWQPLVNDNLQKYNEWNKHPVDFTTRYIQVKVLERAEMPEIVIYGKPLGNEKGAKENRKIQKKTYPDNSTMGELIGINAFIDDPIEKIKVAGFVREYHVWDWDEGNGKEYSGFPNNQNAFNPSYPSDGWRFDAYYKKLKDAGITVATCIQSCPQWLCENDNEKPLQKGLDPLDPASYKEHADHFFQVAARYGNTQVADKLLKLAPNQPRKSGLNLLKYYENWNEQDKDWVTRKEYFSPYEYAAMTSADYDGHMGTMGETFGIKNADPNSKLVMGGISTLNLEYIRSLVFWSEFNRNGTIPFDVINLHHYSNDAGRQRSLGKVGVSPEADSLCEKLKEFVAYRDRHLPEKELWITEFGYDTHPGSIQRAPAIGKFSQEEVQAIWLVRSYLAISSAGFDRAAMYMLRDTEASNSGRQFSASGLTGGKGTKHAPKPSWYYVYTLRNTLNNFQFFKDSSENGIMKYEFKNDDTNEGALVVWLPTSKDQNMEDYKISLPGKTNEASLVKFTNNSTTGSTSEIEARNSEVTVDISEKPIIILFNY